MSPIFEREGWLCQPPLSKNGILFSCKFLISILSREFLGNGGDRYPHRSIQVVCQQLGFG